MNNHDSPESYEQNKRLLMSKLSALKPFMDDPKVTNIFVNPNGKVRVRRFAEGDKDTGVVIPDQQVRTIIKLLASLLGQSVDKWPRLGGILPDYNMRFHALLSPWLANATFTLRKPVGIVRTLDDWVREKRLTDSHAETIREGIRNYDNILVAGSTNSGKTTLLNSIFQEVKNLTPTDRHYIVEDTPEIVCTAEDVIPLVVQQHEAKLAVEDSLRMTPDRVTFGELRHGEVALALLQAWQTHRGGFSTIHATSARITLSRIYELIRQAIVGTPSKAFIAENIHMIVYIKGEPGFGPRVKEIIRVEPELDSKENFVVHNA